VLGERLRRVREGVGRSVTEQVERAILIMGTLDDVIADPLSMGGRAALDEFIAVTAAYDKETPGASLGSFLAYLRVADEREKGLEAPLGEPDPRAVQILTVHGSKGLEWDGVVVFGLSDGVFPSHGKGKKSVAWQDDPPYEKAWLTQGGDLPHPLRGGKQPRILFGTQASSKPPRFVLFTTGFLDPGYRRFIERRLRETFGFTGTPIQISVRVREKRRR